MTAEHCRPSRASEYKIQAPSKLPRITTLRPTYKHILLTNCKLIFSWEPKLDHCLSRKALLNCQRVLPSDIQVCLQNIRSSLKQHFKELHIQYTLLPNTYLQSIHAWLFVHHAKWIYLSERLWCNTAVLKKRAEINSEAGDIQAHHRAEKWTTMESWSSKISLKERIFQNPRLRIILHTKFISNTKPWNCITSIHSDLTPH